MRSLVLVASAIVACFACFWLGLLCGQKREFVSSTVVRAHDIVSELIHLRTSGQTNDPDYLQNKEDSLDLFLSSIATRYRYTDLESWEQERLQDVKRYRSRYHYNGPTNMIVRKRFPVWPRHEEAQSYLDSFKQESEKQKIH